jgi:hypothetical protein
VHRLCKALCRDLILRKVDLARCAQITCPVWSEFCGFVPVRILKETNKEEEELVGVAPHWGKPRISCVDVLVQYCPCDLCIYFLSALLLMYDR